MPSHEIARLRLFALWFAVYFQVCVLAAIATSTLLTLQSNRYHAINSTAIASWLALSCLPALVLSPLIGVLSGSRRAWETMVAASAVSTLIVVRVVVNPGAPLLSVLGIVALASAFFAAATIRLVFATLPAAGVRSTTVMFLFTLGVFVSLPLGFKFGLRLPEEFSTAPGWATYATISYAVLGLAASILARVRPAEFVPLSRGVVGPFAAGVRDAFRLRLAAYSLIGVWLWAFFAGAVVVYILRLVVAFQDLRPESSVENFTTRFAGAILLGIVLSALNRNTYRFGWLIMYAVVAVSVCLAWLRIGYAVDGPLIGIGLALGVSLPALLHYCFTWTTPAHHGVVAALLVAGAALAVLIMGAIVLSIGPDSVMAILLVIAGVAVILAAPVFYRSCLEGTAEFILWPVYRVRAFGPGVPNLPTRGPCLVIGNHAAWFDPLFLAKVLPLPTTPMMTSKFYDLPVLSWIMRRVIGTIRVPDVPFRHEAPELKEAVAALDRGECVVLFPEGYLRRKEEQPLRRFGRGVWKILCDRPTTPVFACWLEGNWGSFFSHRGGPPTKGKRIDFWTHIDVGIVGPIAMDPAVLADHMATRLFLMQQVAAAREPLGLPPIELPGVHEGEKE